MVNHNNDEQFSDPGNILLAERLKQQLSSEQVAGALKLSVSKLEALEKGDYRFFKSEIYLKGYLRNYARLLSIDENIVIDTYVQRNVDSTQFRNEGDVRVKATIPWLLYALIMVSTLIAWFFYQQYFPQDISYKHILPQGSSLQGSQELENPENSVPKVSGSDLISDSWSILFKSKFSAVSEANPLAWPFYMHFSVGEATASNQVTLNPLPPFFSSNLQMRSVIPLVHGQGNVATLAPELFSQKEQQLIAYSIENEEDLSGKELQPEGDVTTLGFSTSESKLLSKDKLVFHFQQDCWLEVQDADGKKIVFGMQKADTELLLEGTAPFHIFMGTTVGASLKLNGEFVSLPTSKGHPSRFEVDTVLMNRPEV